ncbi:MAG: ABC transporter permease [Acidimicrobiales bacterium]
MAGPPALVIARRELRLLAQDPLPLVLLLVVPVVFVGFLKPVLFIALVIEGYPGTNGVEQAAPGAATMFSFLLAGLVGLSFFREHGWGMWDRLRASPATSPQLVVGKLLPLSMFALFQSAWIFATAALLFGLRVRGSVVALVVMVVIATITSVAFAVLVVAVAGTIQQVNALANLGAALLAGLGGAIVPSFLLPGWVQAVGPYTPTYWVMSGYRAVILDGSGFDGIAVPTLVLLLFAAVFAAAALVRFSVEEAKQFWA